MAERLRKGEIKRPFCPRKIIGMARSVLDKIVFFNVLVLVDLT